MDKVRVLIADDSAVMRRIIASALQKDPAIEVVGFAANGLQAIEAIKTLSPDVLTLDIEMPVMDGFGFAELCRNHPKICTIPIFAFTSARNERILQRGQEVGFRDIILKTDRAGLLAAIATTLSKKKENA